MREEPRLLLAVCYLLGALHSCTSCMQTGPTTGSTGGGNTGGNSGSSSPATSKPQTGPYQKCGGSGFPGPAKTGYFDRKGGGPIKKGDDLNCDFDGDCCWTNEQSPADQLEWQQGTGSVDSSAWSNCFGNSKTPQGNYLVLPLDSASQADDNGQWYSCSIACTKKDIKVTLRHWETKGVKLQVCEKDAFDSKKPLSNCKTLQKSPGPETATLPPCQFCDIVIVAKNYVDTQGGMAAIDDIKVNMELCSNKTTTKESTSKTVTPAIAGECTALACNFEKGNPCSYTPLQGGTSRGGEWNVQNNRIGNRDTGVPGPGEGNKYLGTQLAPGQTAVIQSGDLTNTAIAGESRLLTMRYYEATDGIVLQSCKNDINNCQDISSPGVSVADRSWQNAQVQVPPGTNKLLLVAKNSGSNYGSVGVDDIGLSRASAAAVPQSYCPVT